jgi:phosphate transport system substrate-binding protein
VHRALSTLLLSAILGACQLEPAATTAPPPPTPFPEISTTPSFQAWATTKILAFRKDQDVADFIGFGLEILAPSAALEAVDSGQRPLLVSTGPPPAGWFSTPLGWEGVVIAVNRGNRAPAPSLEQLSSIFRGRISNWETLGGGDIPIEPIIPLRGDALRSYLGETLLSGSPFTPAALLGASPTITLSLISERPGAIGILPMSAVRSEVRPLEIDGVAPAAAVIASGEYALRVELLGVAPEEPGGVVRQWLVWLQSRDS